MITLRELFDVFWTITRVEVTARTPELQYIHRWIYGEDIHESVHMYHDRMEGKLSIIDQKINHHGDKTRGGTELAWGVKEKLFPKDILDAPLTHMTVMNNQGGSHTVYVDIQMHELTALSLVKGDNQ